MLNDTSSALALLRSRKSASVKAMGEPGPSPDQLKSVLEVAVRAPDHGKLTPWRFILFEGGARGKIGERFAARWRELHPSHGADAIAFQRGLFLRASLALVVVSRAAPHPKIPEWEQIMSAAAVCENILLAAAALGLGCQWNTDWVAYDPETTKAMGLTGTERVTGILYFGTPTAPLEERPRPDPMALLTRWDG